MTQREKNIEELKKLSDRVIKDSDEITKAVDEARILTPSKQVEKSLTSYITSRLENLKLQWKAKSVHNDNTGGSCSSSK